MVKTLDKKVRLELLRQASPEIQEMYGNEENGQVISETADKLGVKDEATYDTFALTVGDIILGSHPKESLGQMLKDRMEFTDEQVKIATDNLSDFLNKIPKQKVTTGPMVVNAPKDEMIKQEPLQATDTPQSTPALNHELKPLRTFAEDVELSRVHGYGTFQSGEVTEDKDDTPVHRSNQDDIIKK